MKPDDKKLTHNDNNAQAANDTVPSNAIAPKQYDCNGYYHEKDGSLWKKVEDKDKEDICVSEHYINVTALSRTPESDDWNVRVEFDDLDGNRQIISMLRSILLDNKEPLKILADRGFNVHVKSQKNLLSYLQEAKPTQRIRQIIKTGWINDQEYICPSFKASSSNNKENYELANVSKDWGYGISGSLEDWKENIAKYCIDNYILTFSLCDGLSGILLKFFPEISTTVINLVGGTSKGKTTVLQVASSLWGSPKYVKQWRTTDNSLESIAEAHNDALLILDDLGQVDSKRIGEIAYMLGNQKGKGRCNTDASLKKIKSWSMSVLSTGEIELEDKLNEVGIKVRKGHKVRFIDIDAIVSDHGVYNNLHEFKSGADLSNYFKEQTSKYYGTAAEEYVNSLVRQDNFVDRFCDLHKKARELLINRFSLHDADGEVLRSADVFALRVVTGTMAVLFDVFPEEFKIEESIELVFGRWLNDRGGKRYVEEDQISKHIMDCIEQYQDRFKKLIKDGDRLLTQSAQLSIQNLLGYVLKDTDTITYYIIPKMFDEEICKKYGYKIVKRVLSKKGILQKETDDDGIERGKRKTIDGKQSRYITIEIKDETMG
jgi:putative DNA primase/helicase